jgi:hypothetical protein
MNIKKYPLFDKCLLFIKDRSLSTSVIGRWITWREKVTVQIPSSNTLSFSGDNTSVISLDLILEVESGLPCETRQHSLRYGLNNLINPITQCCIEYTTSQAEVKFPHLRTSPSGSLKISRVWSLLPFSIFDMFYGWTLVSHQTDQSCIFTCWFGEKPRELLESNRSKLYLHMLVRGKNPRVARVELLDSL